MSLNARSVRACLSEAGFFLNGARIAEALPPTDLYRLIGRSSRVKESGEPAPYGHRNNQAHIYDDLGLYFIEHHYTFLVSSISFVFEPAEWRPTLAIERAFSGDLIVGNHAIVRGMNERELLKSSVPFRQLLGGWWRAALGAYSIHADATGHRLRSGKRSRSRMIVAVHIGWPDDPWATHARPDRK